MRRSDIVLPKAVIVTTLILLATGIAGICWLLATDPSTLWMLVSLFWQAGIS